MTASQRLLFDLVKCPICRTPVPDTDDDRREHLRWHTRIDEQITYLKNALDRLEALIPEGPTPDAGAAVTIHAWRDTDFEDDDDTEDDTADEPPVPDLALQPSIDRDDDLDSRIANITGSIQ